MSDEKKYTPKEAALAVLSKAKELYENSTLAKSYEGFKAVEASARKSGASDPAAVAAAAGREKYGKEAFQHAAATGKKMGKSDDKESNDKNPDEKEDAKLGETVEDAVHQHEETAEDPRHHKDQDLKGPYRLAKFLGGIEMKKSQKMKVQG